MGMVKRSSSLRMRDTSLVRIPVFGHEILGHFGSVRVVDLQVVVCMKAVASEMRFLLTVFGRLTRGECNNLKGGW
jgi:hypothetical protein